MRVARVTLLLDSEARTRRNQYGLNVFELYIEEILSHAGIPYSVITHISELESAEADILIASVISENEETAELLWKYADHGGVLISYGGLASLAERLGVRKRLQLQLGYALLAEYEFVPVPLRYLHAEAWSGEGPYMNAGSLRKGFPDGDTAGALLQHWEVGSGCIHRWAVDIPTTIVQLQQGTKPVLEDGIPAPDGSAAIHEGILKADDGIELDWHYDRKYTKTGMPYFAYPYADYWREMLLSHLIRCALSRGLTLPFLHSWPEGTEHVALISFDSDFNIDETAATTLDVLKKLEVPSTWCMIEPGYSTDVYERVLQEGHELALHYNALEKEDGVWGSEAFRRQLEWVQSATGVNRIVSNKNHYTRYEGWGELFQWCEANGIAVDQTRGPTKRGNVGFLFGTCQPYFPISWFDEANRLYDVLEIGFVTQDLNHPSLSDTSIIEPLLEQVKNVGGVAHFLFHQIHMHELEPVRYAIGEVAEKARKLGYSFWTSEQINDWQRARRMLRIREIDSNGKVQVDRNGERAAERSNIYRTAQLQAGGTAEAIAVWIPIAKDSLTDDSATKTNRYGVPCMKQIYEQQ